MSIRGCVVKKSGTESVNFSSGNNAVAFDSEVFDTDGFHDNATSNSRITIPSSVNGQYGVLTACLSVSSVNTSSDAYLTFSKNGATAGVAGAIDSVFMLGNGQATDKAWLHIVSGPLLLATNDYYEAAANFSDSAITLQAESNFGIYIDDNQTITQRCLAALNADLTTQNISATVALAFSGTDVYDTDSIHDPASANTKLIIPSALNGKYGVVHGGMHTSNETGQSQISVAIRKNSSLTYDGFSGRSGTTVNGFTNGALSAQTNLVQFATNDFYELLVYTNDTSITILNNPATFLGLWVYG